MNAYPDPADVYRNDRCLSYGPECWQERARALPTSRLSCCCEHARAYWGSGRRRVESGTLASTTPQAMLRIFKAPAFSCQYHPPPEPCKFLLSSTSTSHTPQPRLDHPLASHITATNDNFTSCTNKSCIIYRTSVLSTSARLQSSL